MKTGPDQTVTTAHPRPHRWSHFKPSTRGQVRLSQPLDFHSVIRDNCGNGLLVENLRRVQARVIVATYTTAWVSAHEVVVDEHEAILKALEARDADAAERAAIEHLERLIGRVQAHFETATN
ncbi:FCD domain-containing protein [Mycolicibacterium phlei]|uniref:FCD domain-containing protein n=1 Tax=Mycolicibacterium phlei TaxID=1771 RepID=UPI001FD5166A|nr:FCD domain-containing protein [Mycolicibacterium phlei]